MWFGKLLRSRRETSGANSFAKISASAPPKRNERIVPTFSRIASRISITFCDKYCYASTSPTRYFLSSESMLTRLSVVKMWNSSRYTKKPVRCASDNSARLSAAMPISETNRQLSALHRGKIRLRLKPDGGIASGRWKLTTRGISLEPILAAKLHGLPSA